MNESLRSREVVWLKGWNVLTDAVEEIGRLTRILESESEIAVEQCMAEAKGLLVLSVVLRVQRCVCVRARARVCLHGCGAPVVTRMSASVLARHITGHTALLTLSHLDSAEYLKAKASAYDHT